jgi:hypothetical protein
MITATINQSIMYYKSGDPGLKYNFSPSFGVNDTNCDPFTFTYVINTTSTKLNQNILVYNISDFPSVVNGATTSGDYFSVFTQSYSDSAYIMNFTITAYTPDKRTSSFVSAIIYMNKYLPGIMTNPFNSFTFIQVDKINIYEDLILSIKNYFITG